jgi:hypothetical protein
MIARMTNGAAIRIATFTAVLPVEPFTGTLAGTLGP